MVEENFSQTNKTKGKLPSLPFEHMKNEILGQDYELSLVFVNDEESKALNMEHRNGDYIPNVLSFPLNDVSGEIFINPSEARRQAKDFGRTPENMIGFLYIHGLCHLKGMTHGSKMEKAEATFRKIFGI
jgi:probable rRNA maturation factor